MPGTLDSTSSSLLNGLKALDDEAWRRLVQIYGPLVAQNIRRRGIPVRDTEDLVQEVFQRVHRGIGAFQKDSFRGWLTTITRSVVIDHCRKVSDQPSVTGGSDHWQWLDQIQADESLDEDEFPWSEIYQRVRQVIESKFDRVTWQYFWETVVEKRSAEEVAREHGVSKWAVYKAKQRVIEQIKLEIGELPD